MATFSTTSYPRIFSSMAPGDLEILPADSLFLIIALILHLEARCGMSVTQVIFPFQLAEDTSKPRG